jgi:hypothetical protein
MAKRSLQLCAVVVGLTLVAGVVHAQRPGQTFKSPLNDFTVEVPDFPLGTKVQKYHTKDDGLVAFSGGAGNFQRIDYFRIPADRPVPTDSAGRHAYYQKLLDALLQEHPNRILAERDDAFDGVMMLHALVALPAGGLMYDAGRGTRVDSIRGMLVFARGGFAYVLQDEVGAPVFNQPGEVPTTEELARRAESSLPKLYRSITFR